MASLVPSVQPLDLNPDYQRLLATHGDGHSFGTEDVAALLNMRMWRARRFLVDVREALADCPEGEQLIVRRGAASLGGGHRFVEGALA